MALVLMEDVQVSFQVFRLSVVFARHPSFSTVPSSITPNCPNYDALVGISLASVMMVDDGATSAGLIIMS